MLRALRTATLLSAAPTVLVLGLTAASPAGAAATGLTAHPDACTTAVPIEIDGFAFDPAEVLPGQSATADLISTNCTGETLATQEEWTAAWLPSATAGSVAGCPVLDPLIRDVTYAPEQELAENTLYTVPIGCTAAELEVTVTISIPTSSAAQIATATAYLVIDQSGA